MGRKHTGLDYDLDYLTSPATHLHSQNLLDFDCAVHQPPFGGKLEQARMAVCSLPHAE